MHRTGFDLMPLVVDADSAPLPAAPGLSWAALEMAVLAALTGAADLTQDAARRMVLSAIAGAGAERLETYTPLVRAEPPAARAALEVLSRSGRRRPNAAVSHRVKICRAFLSKTDKSARVTCLLNR